MIAPVSGHARLRTWIAAVSRAVAWWPWLGLALIGCGCARGSHEPVRPDANASSSAWWMFDGHVDVTVHYARAGWRLDAHDLAAATRGQTTLDRLAHGRVGGGFFTCGSPSDAAPRWPGLAACLTFLPTLMARHADRVMLVSTADEVARARTLGRLAWIPSIEGGDQIDGDLSHLAALRAAGVRSFGLVYDRDNDLGDGAQAFVERMRPPRHGGLSALGARAVDELSRLGILVDVAHAAESTALAVAARSHLPVIASHTAAAALVPTPRNASDAVLRAIAATDGVVMVTFLPELTDRTFGAWMAAGDAYWFALQRESPDSASARTLMSQWERGHPRPAVSIAAVADHVDYVARTIGARHVGLGSDFDGMDYTIPGLEDPRGVPALVQELQRRGWNDADVAALTHGNILRVLAAADAAVARP